MTLSRRSILLHGAAFAGSCLAGPAIAVALDPPALPPEDLERLATLVDQSVSSGQTPGISLAVWRGGTDILSRNAGLANLSPANRVAGDSVFRVGSLTKQFVGALALKLESLGKLSLAAPARDYLPFLAAHEPFTVLELLNHTAGVRDGDYDTSTLQTRSQIEQARRIAQQQPFFDFAPGSAWLYSNANYILVGAIIEQVTGTSLAEAAATLLFGPLGLHDTAFDSVSDVVPGRANGYTPGDRPGRAFVDADYLDVSLAGAAGAMRSTAADLRRWQRALFQGQAVSPALAAKMIEPGRLRNGQLASTHRHSDNDSAMGDTQYGLGLMLDTSTIDGSLIAHHHGGINGFASYLAIHVPSGLGLACLCNVDTHPGLPFRDIRRIVFREFLQASPRSSRR